MINLDELKSKLDVDKYMVMLEDRRAALLQELGEVQESLGEELTDLFSVVDDFVDNKIKANIKLILIGVGIFFTGTFIGALSVFLSS